jgi:hypothetical protein
MIITEKELLKFFGEDEPKEIARYMSIWINAIARGEATAEHFILEAKDDEMV